MNWDGPPANWFLHAPLIVDRNLLERMSEGGAPEIDAFLLREIRLLKREYQRTGNPRIIYLAGRAVADTVSPMRGRLYSLQFSKLHALLAEMILAQGRDVVSLRVAMEHLELAFEALYRVQALDEDIIRYHVSYALLFGIAKKALGNFDESVKDMQKIARHLTLNKSATELDLIPLRRQEVMMRQTIMGHRQLAECAVQYATTHPKEYYRSLKRVLEFLLNKGRIKEAEQLYPEFQRSFAAVAGGLPPISQVSFMKNVGQYLMTKGKVKEAAGVFKLTLAQAGQRNLHGQVRQVRTLMQELKEGNRLGKLITFTAE